MKQRNLEGLVHPAISVKNFPSGTFITYAILQFKDGNEVFGVKIIYPDGTRRFIANSWYVDIDINNL